MEIFLDKWVKFFLNEVKVDEETFISWIAANINSENYKHVIHDGNDDVRVFRVFRSKRRDTIISLSGMECLAVIKDKSVKVINIPDSVYGNCSIAEATNILLGLVKEPESFMKFLKKAYK